MGPVHRKRVHRIISSGGLIIGAALLASAIGKSPVERIGPILFQTNRDGNAEIYAMDANGENIRRLTEHGARDGGPRWSPDGKKVLFSANRQHGFQIYTMDPDGSNVTNISGLETVNNGEADWSPNGKRIVFVSSRDGNDEIYVMDADGSNQTRLTNDPTQDYWPAWSPDGSKIAFTSRRGGPSELYTMNPDGTELFKVTSPPAGAVEGVSWSPNGKKIAFVSGDPGFNGINIINADGTERVALTNSTRSLQDRFPVWSPDGKEILYSSNVAPEGYQFELFTISVDGSNKKRLTTSNLGIWNISADWGRRAFMLTPKLFR